MRHSLYANSTKRAVDRSYKSSVNTLERFTGHKARKPPEPVNYASKLESRLKALLALYKDDPETVSEIRGKASMYEANVAIARAYHDKRGEKRLEAEFLEYIKNKEKR